MKKDTACIAVLALLLSGCSANYMKTGGDEPQFYPNEQYERAGPTQVRADTDYCMRLGEEYVSNSSRYKDLAYSTLGGGAVGAAAGAVGGAIYGDAARGTGAGAAGGAIVGLLGSLFKSGQGNPDYKSFVDQCLADKGYRVYTWG